MRRHTMFSEDEIDTQLSESPSQPLAMTKLDSQPPQFQVSALSEQH
jgi:hypothetical protein